MSEAQELIAAGVLAEPELWVTLSEAQELIAAGVLAELELLGGAQRATDSAALVSPPIVPSVEPPSITGIGVGSGTLGTMTTLDGVI